MDNEYYILNEGERIGPFTPRELMDRPLEPADVILSALQTQGVPAYSLPEFTDYFKKEGIYFPTQQNTSSYILRLPAFIIDIIMVIIISMVLGAFLAPQYLNSLQPGVTPENFNYNKFVDNMMKHRAEINIINIIVFVINNLYNAACEASRLQGSVGKYAMGLAVVDELGYSLTFGQALIRNFGKLFYQVASLFISILAYATYLRMVWGDRHQAFHDMMAKCYVVKKSA